MNNTRRQQSMNATRTTSSHGTAKLISFSNFPLGNTCHVSELVPLQEGNWNFTYGCKTSIAPRISCERFKAYIELVFGSLKHSTKTENLENVWNRKSELKILQIEKPSRKTKFNKSLTPASKRQKAGQEMPNQQTSRKNTNMKSLNDCEVFEKLQKQYKHFTKIVGEKANPELKCEQSDAAKKEAEIIYKYFKENVLEKLKKFQKNILNDSNYREFKQMYSNYQKKYCTTRNNISPSGTPKSSSIDKKTEQYLHYKKFADETFKQKHSLLLRNPDFNEFKEQFKNLWCEFYKKFQKEHKYKPKTLPRVKVTPLKEEDSFPINHDNEYANVYSSKEPSKVSSNKFDEALPKTKRRQRTPSLEDKNSNNLPSMNSKEGGNEKDQKEPNKSCPKYKYVLVYLIRGDEKKCLPESTRSPTEKKKPKTLKCVYVCPGDKDSKEKEVEKGPLRGPRTQREPSSNKISDDPDPKKKEEGKTPPKKRGTSNRPKTRIKIPHTYTHIYRNNCNYCQKTKEEGETSKKLTQTGPKNKERIKIPHNYVYVYHHELLKNMEEKAASKQSTVENRDKEHQKVTSTHSQNHRDSRKENDEEKVAATQTGKDNDEENDKENVAATQTGEDNVEENDKENVAATQTGEDNDEENDKENVAATQTGEDNDEENDKGNVAATQTEEDKDEENEEE